MDLIGNIISNMGVIEKAYDTFIILFAVYIFIRLKAINSGLMKIAKEAESAHRATRGETKLDASGNLSRESSTELNKEKYEPIRENYNAQTVTYVKYVNLITVLPLLGLLGTVFGLIPGLSAADGGDIKQLASALSTALTSTCLGLIGTVILKIYSSIKPDTLVNKIKMNFEEIDRLYDNAIGLKKMVQS